MYSACIRNSTFKLSSRISLNLPLDLPDDYKDCMSRLLDYMARDDWELANNALSSAGLLLSIFTPMQRMNYITGYTPHNLVFLVLVYISVS